MTADKRLHAFGRSCHLIIHSGRGSADELAALAQDELDRLESKFSSFKSESIISRINQSAGTGVYTQLDAEARSLFAYATTLWRESNHLFDPSTRLLGNCYTDDGRLCASDAQLRDMLSLVGWDGLKVTDEGAYLTRKGMLIDLNSCVCPYAADSIRKLLLKRDVGSAMIDFDQDIVTIGKQADGANWLVGVRHPRGGRTAITRLKVNGGGFARRGDFERKIRIGEENFGRGLSPVDGRPVPGLLSVVVRAENCLTACSAASIARLKTEQAAMQWLDGLGLPWMAIDRELNCRGPLAP